MQQMTVGDYVYNVEIREDTDVLIAPESEPLFALDTETVPIQDGHPTIPALLQVCCHATRQVHVIPAENIDAYLCALFARNPDAYYAMHSAPFDLEVLGLLRPDRKFLLDAVKNRKVIDTGIRYILHSLAMGRVAHDWRLFMVARDILKIEITKDDDIRLTFSPGMELSDDHIEYAAKDSAVTAQIALAMPAYKTEFLQLIGFIALSDIGRRGMSVDRNYLRELQERFQNRFQGACQQLSAFGFYPGEKGNEAVKQKIMRYIEQELQFVDGDTSLKFQRTDKKGDIQMTDQSLEIMGTHRHPFIEAHTESSHCTKVLTTFLKDSLVREDDKVHPVFTPLVRTGRTSCKRPNLQQLPRKENIRGIYLPSKGYLFYDVDYAQLELCALAQTCLEWQGKSRMAEVINEGQDLHSWFAAAILGKDVGLVTKEERQIAKACNFGFPGGLGIRTFQVFAVSNYDIELPLDRCRELKRMWLDAFPEMRQHLKPQPDQTYSSEEDQTYITRTTTGRIRRNASYCSACNNPFQGLAADGARLALWVLFLDRFRMVNFIHDEIIFELEELDPQLQSKIRRINELMIWGMKQVITRVNISVDGTLMRRWYKEAEPVLDGHGNLLVWEPTTT
jgi:DNA polymerase I-like protein with 3'-5' exonuclease and polymerase domains